LSITQRLCEKTINQQTHNYRFCIGLYRGANGRLTLKVLPFPGSLSTSMVPLCRAMMPYTTDKPRPTPFHLSLVVKKGSKIFSLSSSVMPQPVSETMTSKNLSAPAFLLAATVRVPPSIIASEALYMRFNRAC
jgi:hypothetical protein